MSRENELARIASMEKELLELKKLVVSGDAVDKSKQYEDTFLELMNQGLTIKIGDGLVTYSNIKGEWMVQQNLKTKDIWLSYSRFWSVFESKFNLNYNDTRTLLNGLVETHTDLKGYTPSDFTSIVPSIGRDTYRFEGVYTNNYESLNKVLW